MIRVAVVIPEIRIAHTLAPVVRAAIRRAIPIVRGTPPPDLHIRVAVGLDGFTRGAQRIVTVDNFFDCFLHAPSAHAVMCYASRYHYETHYRLWRHAGPEADSAIVGWLGAEEFPPITARSQAVFFTPKLRGVDPTRSAWWFRRSYFKAFAHAVALARRQKLHLVVKGRKKHGDPWWIRALAAEYVTDAQSSIALLHRAKWCLHFGSAAALEAAYAGAFAYWMPAPESHLTAVTGSQYRPRMFAWPGVSRCGLPDGSESLDPCARREYVETYLGNCDGKAADRVLDLAESLA